MTLHLAGKRFGRLLVTDEVKSVFRVDRPRRFWKCLCNCGEATWIEASNLTTGNSTSCKACCKIEHGHTSRSKQSRTYKSWAAMLNRCRNENCSMYYLYGGRRIKVCKRWFKFSNFLADMGERPTNKTIERRDNNKGYRPSNCYWGTSKEQGYNRRTTKLSFEKAKRIRALYAKGVIKAEIARIFAVSFSAISCVLDGSRWS